MKNYEIRDGIACLVEYEFIDQASFGLIQLPIHIVEIESTDEYDISYVTATDANDNPYLVPSKIKKTKPDKLKNPSLNDVYALIYEIAEKLEVR